MTTVLSRSIGSFVSAIALFAASLGITRVSLADDASPTSKPDVGGSADLVVAKYLVGATTDIRPGSTVQFLVNIFVAGGYGISIADVTVTETVPANTTFAAASSSPEWNCPNGSAAGTKCVITWSLLSGSASPQFVVRVSDSIPAGVTEISNTAHIYSPNDSTGSNNTASVAVPLSLWNIVAEKTAHLNDSNGNNLGDLGESIDYVVWVTNTGTGPVNNVGVQDSTFIGYVEPSSVTNTLGTANLIGPPNGGLQTVGAFVSSLGPGQFARISFRQVISGTIPPYVREVVNNAMVQLHTNPYFLLRTNTVTTPLTAHVDLGIQKQVSYPNGLGQSGPIVFAINVWNVGAAPATGVVLTETLPPHSQFEPGQSTPGWVCLGITCTFQLGELPPNPLSASQRSLTFSISALATIPVSTVFATNTVVVGDDGSHGPDAVPASNTASIPFALGIRAPLSVTKSAGFAFDANGNGKANPGDTLEYRISITNTGTRPAFGVNLRDVIATACGFFCGPWQQISVGTSRTSRGAITETIDTLDVWYGDIAAGETVTASFRVLVNSDPPPVVVDVANTARVADAFLQVTDSNTTHIPIARARDMQVVKGVVTELGRPYVTSGERITFTITATNTGSDALSGVVLRDSYYNSLSNHQGFGIVPGTESATTGVPVISGSNNQDIEVTLGSVAPGAVVTLAFSADAIPFPIELQNFARARWEYGYSGEFRDSNVITREMRRGQDLAVGVTNWYQPLTETVRSIRLTGREIFYTPPPHHTATSAVITQQVPLATTFNAAASTPGWSCPAGGTAGNFCTYALGSPPTTNSNTAFWPEITFAVTINPDAVTQALRHTATTAIADTTPGALPDPIPSNNSLTTSIWFVLPVIVSQSAVVLDTNSDGQISHLEVVNVRMTFTNTLGIDLPEIFAFTTNVNSRFQRLFSSGWLTTSTGVFSYPSFNVQRPCPIPSSTFVSHVFTSPVTSSFVTKFSFDTQYTDYPNQQPYSGPYIMQTVVCDEYGTQLGFGGDIPLTFVQPSTGVSTPTPIATVTPTSTPTSTSTSTPTPTAMVSAPSPTPTATQISPDRKRAWLPMATR